MAYNEQPSYRAAPRPQHQYRQPSYESSHQPYAAEYDYAPEEHSVSSDGRYRPGPPQQYSNTYQSDAGGSRYEQRNWQDGGMGNYGGRDRYEGRDWNGDRNGGGRIPEHHAWEQPEGKHAYNDPRGRGQARSKSRPPERNRYQEADFNGQPGPFRDPQSYRHQHPPDRRSDNGAMGQDADSYDLYESTNDYQNGWGMDRQYADPREEKHRHHGTRNRMENQRQDHSGKSNESTYQNDYMAAPGPTGPQKQGQFQSTQSQQPSVASKSEKSQQSKSSGKQFIKPPVSPDTVAWDNPFPTFPSRPKKTAQSGSKSSDGSMAEGNFKNEHNHHNDNHARPHTASSQSSNHAIPQTQGIGNAVVASQDYGHESSHRSAQSQQRDRGLEHEGPGAKENSNFGDHRGNLRPPIVNGRHSEDNRSRPIASIDSGLEVNHERSRTMPTAVSEAVIRPNNRPRPAVQTSREEPGQVAGYYGPEDRGYTPTSPQRPKEFTYRRPQNHVGANSDERRPYGHAAVQNEYSSRRQPHTPQDSLGDVLDNYYDSPQQERSLSGRPEGSHRQISGEDEMPNFDAATDPSANHRRGFTIDKHLQQQQPSREYPPMPLQSQKDGRSNQRSDTSANWPVPRSRSQPNLNDGRSPRQQYDEGFNFGVPETSTRPPATAPARGGYGYGDEVSTGFSNSNERPLRNGHYQRGQRVPEATGTAGYHDDNWNVSSSRSGPPPPMHHNNGPPDRFRSPPQDRTPHNPPPLTYQDRSQSDRFRSPPLPGGMPRQGPPRPSTAGSAGGNRDAVKTALPGAYQNDARPSAAPEKHSRNDQIVPSGSKPSPNDRRGPTSQPPKSPVNPDALPAHPAPVRAGLMGDSPVNQAAKPTPVRQYNATPSPMQLSDPSQKPGASRPVESKRTSAPVTHQELDKLRQATLRNPNDMASQLVLAKKLVEAASVLVDERADSRARSKSREKYIFEAHKIVKKLSSSGFTEATFYLADCYTRGALGLESDTREAFKLYQTAAKAGHAQAAYRVAVCCEIGQEEGGGTSRDPVKAMQWYKRAATLGDTPAMYKMGIISLKGLLGQPKNPREAIVWLKRAAERADEENPHALHELALLHENPSNNDGINKDEAYSKQLFTQAANLGYKFSQYRLGSAYEYGLMKCPVDPRQSIAWYSKAAVQEEHQSELALSGWYLTGSEGILQQSDTEAYLWARKAAQAGLAKAEYAMGYFTEVGIGAPANLEDAKRWYWRAASQNFPKARDRLEDLRKGGPTKRKERVSRSNMRKSTEGECIVM